MLQYDVKMQLDDDTHAIHLEVYQRVKSEVDTSEDEILLAARQQFRQWAEQQGSDWKIVVARLPFTTVSHAEINLAA